MIADDRPTPPWRAAALTALALLLAVAAWTDVGALAGPPPSGATAATASSEDDAKQKATLDDFRTIGTAMMSWLTDAALAGSTGGNAAGPAEAEERPAPTTADWSDCPRISHEELAKVLVGTYLPALPRTDRWGHEIEFCLDRDNPVAAPRYVLGVRSPGRDGRWQGDLYPIGGFAIAEVDRDLVWIDGYFVTWPEQQ